MSTGQARRCGSPRSCPGIAHYSMLVASGDPYLSFARMAGLAPPDAVKATHKSIRDVCKTVVLGANYCMGAEALAYRTGLSKMEWRSCCAGWRSPFPCSPAGPSM